MMLSTGGEVVSFIAFVPSKTSLPGFSWTVFRKAWRSASARATLRRTNRCSTFGSGCCGHACVCKGTVYSGCQASWKDCGEGWSCT